MTLKELQSNLKTPIFNLQEVAKLFPTESKNTINMQIKRMINRGDLERIRNGLYRLPNTRVDEYVLANLLYQPSYVSLETVLNNLGVIPDITMNVTSITTVTSKIISTTAGTFLYSKIAKDLYYGFDKIKDSGSSYYCDVACVEKALLDLIYVRRVRSLGEYRFDFSDVNAGKLNALAEKFPRWVKEVLNEQFKILV
ncbi:TPA: hypothetical protein DCY43_03350 [candidate division WWE3 bacterium]|uniref:Transcriptional regulator n=2 Tax=Katanobacteria TaxID=422282 RepID=A0A1F4V749_UNCKA|nr:MAG: hypothetical protein A2709_02160 [candidate division WWE3 bacterium RIFCSPHIGHO2_01_FULL_43_9]HAZ29751.1 hypothetical protein [candidate division WWE3 bacterium]